MLELARTTAAILEHKPQCNNLLLPPMHVTGLDQAADVLELARATAETLGHKPQCSNLVLPPGHVTGLDQAADVLELARATAAERGVTNIDFATGDVHALDYPDSTFDVVHIHQVGHRYA